jgi:TRAP-type mannitol/chloroaromatic compound transport system substrate-binding protein
MTLGASAALPAASGIALADNRTFNTANVVSGGPIWTQGAVAFADLLSQLSGGRLAVENFPGGAIGPALRVSGTVRDGIADFGFTWMSYDWGRDPACVLFAGFPGSMESEALLHWLYAGGGLEMQRQFREEVFGVVSFPMLCIPTEVFLHSNKPVRTLSDLQGLKFRTAGAWLEIAQTLGAAPVTMAPDEIYPALERGVVDAIEWSTPSQNIAAGFHEISQYVIIPGAHQPVAPWELVVNEGVWNGLDPADQHLIETAARLVTTDSWFQTGHEDLEALRFYEEQGKEIIELDSETQQAIKSAAVDWADAKAQESEWFDRVWESQKAYERLWNDAGRYRRLSGKLS